MKKMQKISALISALFLLSSVTLFTSCDQLVGKAKDTVENIETEIIDEALAKMGDNFISSYVDADTDSITLPKTIPDYESVRLSWTSSNEAIINPTTGAVTHNEGTDVDEVNLTATLSYDKKTRTKVYTVEVEQKSPDILGKAYAAMKSNFIVDYVEGDTITLPKTISGYDGVTITWTSSDSSIIDVTSGKVTHKEGTGVDEVTLTATLTYKGKNKTKEFKVKVSQKRNILSEAIAAMSEDLIPSVVTGDSITLPQTVPGYSDVSITWSSSNESIIDPKTGTVKHQKGTGDDNVTLTATLTYEGKTETKEYTVKVPQADKELTDAEILEVAKGKVEILYTAKKVFEEITLPNEIEVEGKTIALSYNCESDASTAVINNYGNEKSIKISKDIVDRTATVIVTLKYNEISDTKEISIKIPALSEYTSRGYNYDFLRRETKYTFNNATNVLTKVEDDFGENIKEGWQYSYEVLDNHKIKLTTLKVLEPMSEEWLTIDELIAQRCDQYIKLNELINNPPVSYEDLFEKLNEVAPMDQKTFERYIGYCGGQEGDSSEVQVTVINTLLELFTQMMGISEDNTIEDIIEAQKRSILKSYPDNVDYTYIIVDTYNQKEYPDNFSLSFKAEYMKAKSWYDQRGSFSDDSYEYRIDSSSTDVKINGNYYIGNWNENYSSFTAKTNDNGKPLDEPFTINIQDNKDGTITISGGIISGSAKLSFNPEYL